MTQPGRGEIGGTGRLQNAVDLALLGRAGRGGEGQRHRPQVEVEQAVAQARLVVVITLGRGLGDDLDLSVVEAEALVDVADLRFARQRVGQEDAAGAALDDCRSDAGILDVGQRLCGEDDADVLLAQSLEPLADARGEQRIVEKQPGLVEDQQGRRAVEALLETGEQITQSL